MSFDIWETILCYPRLSRLKDRAKLWRRVASLARCASNPRFNFRCQPSKKLWLRHAKWFKLRKYFHRLAAQQISPAIWQPGSTFLQTIRKHISTGDVPIKWKSCLPTSQFDCLPSKWSRTTPTNLTASNFSCISQLSKPVYRLVLASDTHVYTSRVKTFGARFWK